MAELHGVPGRDCAGRALQLHPVLPAVPAGQRGEGATRGPAPPGEQAGTAGPRDGVPALLGPGRPRGLLHPGGKYAGTPGTASFAVFN